MKLNLNFKLRDLAGDEIENSDSVAKLLANALAIGQSDDPVKMMGIALELYQSGEVDLDESDLEKLTNEVKTNKTFTDILKARILTEIKNVQLKQTEK